MRRQNLLHRAVSVMCRDSDGNVYVHRRTTTKDLSPGMYEMFVSGVVRSGESYEEAARRELAEELGVVGARLQWRFRHLFLGAKARCWIAVYELECAGPFTPQAEEIEWAVFVSWETLMHIRRTLPFTEDNLAILDHYVACTSKQAEPSV